MKVGLNLRLYDTNLRLGTPIVSIVIIWIDGSVLRHDFAGQVLTGTLPLRVAFASGGFAMETIVPKSVLVSNSKISILPIATLIFTRVM